MAAHFQLDGSSCPDAHLVPMVACLTRWIVAVALAGAACGAAHASGGHADPAGTPGFPLPMEHYERLEAARAAETGRDPGLGETLLLRARTDPFNVAATFVFLLAITHTFLCAKFTKLAHRTEEVHRKAIERSGTSYPPGREPVSFHATVYHLLGEVEAVFGLWLVPLIGLLFLAPHHGWKDVVGYIDSRDFTEAIFVVVIMAIASSRPVIFFAQSCMRKVASVGHESPAAWWLSILLIAPVLGSFITEPAAMTIGALLLGRQFYQHHPSVPLRYATLGLLFVSVSVGGTLTHFAAPPILMVSGKWHWDMAFMFTQFGWRAVLGILIATAGYFLVFRKELLALGTKTGQPQAGAASQHTENQPVPLWVTGVHLAFLAWTVINLHHPALFVFGFLFFIAFTRATRHYQYLLAIRGPILVGFFLAALVVHGGLQGWWIAPLLASLSDTGLFFTGLVLTAFNDNAAITYLGSQVPAFSPDHLVNGVLAAKEGADLAAAQALQYALVAGAVAGGGLTVIANAPNPAGQSLLAKYFGENGVAPGSLLLGALFPTAVMVFCFLILPH
jgi:hypothetical protein